MKTTTRSILMFTFTLSTAASTALAQNATTLTIMAPSSVGGGWDLLAHGVADTLKASGREKNPAVVNVAGKAGTVGLSEFMNWKGQPGKLMVTGFVMVAGIPVNNSPYLLSRDVTPIAALVAENDVLIVPATSRFQTVEDLIAALKANPGAVRFGGSSLGGTGHIAFAKLAKVLDLPLKTMKFVPSAGGMQAAKALRNGEMDVVSTGYTEIDELVNNKSIRVLAVLSEDRLPGVNAPTLKEKGLDVVVANWRGIVAPGGITALEKSRLDMQIHRMVRTPAWQNLLKQNKWQDTYMNATDFKRYLQFQESTIPALLKDLEVVK